MAKANKKPAGWRAFDKLARKIAKVPKAEVDALVASSKRKRRK